MPDTITMEMFSNVLNTPFQMHYGNSETAELKLIGVRDLGSSPTHTQFSLTFLGPLTCPPSQRIYKVEHAALGELQIFLVPVARNESGLEYEAIYNLQKS